MPRDTIREFMDVHERARRRQTFGKTITRFALTPYDPIGTLVPVADIMISGFIVSGIPLSANNRELQYIVPGTAVTLSRSESGRLEVTGVNKRGSAKVSYYEYQVPELTPETSAGVSALLSGLRLFIGRDGGETRALTLGELADEGGFGNVPLGAEVLTDADGTTLRIV